jgi:hypothetical protein
LIVQLFIFVLCQASLKPLVGKILGLSPGRHMQGIQPSMPKKLR